MRSQVLLLHGSHPLNHQETSAVLFGQLIKPQQPILELYVHLVDLGTYLLNIYLESVLFSVELVLQIHHVLVLVEDFTDLGLLLLQRFERFSKYFAVALELLLHRVDSLFGRLNLVVCYVLNAF